MPYKIAGIDVHKRMLHVVVSDVQVDGEYDFTRCIFGSLPEALRSLAAWLVEQQVEEVVMESTAQYWKPVWGALERYWKPPCQKREDAGPMSGTLHLAQAQSNRGRHGRKKDRRLVSRLGHNQTIGAIAHRLCRLIWIILHRGVRYEERGPSVNAKSRQRRTHKMIRELRNLGYRVEPVGAA